MVPYDIRRFETIDSTNAYLLREAAAGGTHGLVAVAAAQTAGRGRLGRRWEAPPGSALLCSVLLRPELPAERVPLLTLAAAVAMREAVLATSGVAVSIKWPNDLRVGGRKLAGILAEALSRGDDLAVVVGVGVNLRHAALSPDVAATATSLEEAGALPVPTPSQLLDAFLTAFDPGLGGDLLARYRAACETVGMDVHAQTEGGEISGRAVGIAADGALEVETRPGDVRRVAFGEVVHLLGG